MQYYFHNEQQSSSWFRTCIKVFFFISDIVCRFVRVKWQDWAPWQGTCKSQQGGFKNAWHVRWRFCMSWINLWTTSCDKNNEGLLLVLAPLVTANCMRITIKKKQQLCTKLQAEAFVQNCILMNLRKSFVWMLIEFLKKVVMPVTLSQVIYTTLSLLFKCFNIIKISNRKDDCFFVCLFLI